jgi:hypothetical protein
VPNTVRLHPVLAPEEPRTTAPRGAPQAGVAEARESADQGGEARALQPLIDRGQIVLQDLL